MIEKDFAFSFILLSLYNFESAFVMWCHMEMDELSRKFQRIFKNECLGPS